MSIEAEIPHIMQCVGERLAPTFDAIMRRILSLEAQVAALSDAEAFRFSTKDDGNTTPELPWGEAEEASNE